MNEVRIQGALGTLVGDVQHHYGDRLAGVYRIDRSGSLEDVDRSEAEVVVVLKDGSWRPFDEARELAGLAFEILMDAEVYIRAWPVSSAAWNDPSEAQNPDLVREFKRHSEPIREAA